MYIYLNINIYKYLFIYIFKINMDNCLDNINLKYYYYNKY